MSPEMMAFMQQSDRRHDANEAQSSRKTREQPSAAVVLECLLDRDAIIDWEDTNHCANQAFTDIRGYRLAVIRELAFEDIFAGTQNNEYLPWAIPGYAEQIVDLVRCKQRHAGQD